MYRKQENNHPEKPDHTMLNILAPPRSKVYSIYILVCQETQDVSCNFQVSYTDLDALFLIDFKPTSVHGIFQARVLGWGAIAFSDRRGLGTLKSGRAGVFQADWLETVISSGTSI